MLWYDQHFRNMDEAERLNDAIRDWMDATGWWRDACRIYAHKLLMRMIRERDAGRANLKAAANITQGT